MSAPGTADTTAASLAEQAYLLLEQKLVSLELPPGTMISEGRLIAMTGLGRTPVREACLLYTSDAADDNRLV